MPVKTLLLLNLELEMTFTGQLVDKSTTKKGRKKKIDKSLANVWED